MEFPVDNYIDAWKVKLNKRHGAEHRDGQFKINYI